MSFDFIMNYLVLYSYYDIILYHLILHFIILISKETIVRRVLRTVYFIPSFSSHPKGNEHPWVFPRNELYIIEPSSRNLLVEVELS